MKKIGIDLTNENEEKINIKKLVTQKSNQSVMSTPLLTPSYPSQLSTSTTPDINNNNNNQFTQQPHAQPQPQQQQQDQYQFLNPSPQQNNTYQYPIENIPHPISYQQNNINDLPQNIANINIPYQIPSNQTDLYSNQYINSNNSIYPQPPITIVPLPLSTLQYSLPSVDNNRFYYMSVSAKQNTLSFPPTFPSSFPEEINNQMYSYQDPTLLLDNVINYGNLAQSLSQNKKLIEKPKSKPESPKKQKKSINNNKEKQKKSTNNSNEKQNQSMLNKTPSKSFIINDDTFNDSFYKTPIPQKPIQPIQPISITITKKNKKPPKSTSKTTKISNRKNKSININIVTNNSENETESDTHGSTTDTSFNSLNNSQISSPTIRNIEAKQHYIVIESNKEYSDKIVNVLKKHNIITHQVKLVSDVPIISSCYYISGIFYGCEYGSYYNDYVDIVIKLKNATNIPIICYMKNHDIPKEIKENLNKNGINTILNNKWKENDLIKLINC